MTATLLYPEDGAAFREITGANSGLLLACDHASNRIPVRLGDLGVGANDLNCHIAFDIGAARVTELMAERLQCSALFGCFSRLVVDINRHPDVADFIPEYSDGTVIPGNVGLSPEQKYARETEIFTPYQNAIKKTLLRLDSDTFRAPLLSIHSFTPALKHRHEQRPWHIGVVWNRDPDTAGRLLTYLQQIPGLCIGDNEPYSMKTQSGYTQETHAEGKRPSVLIEIRNDLINDEEGCVVYANILSGFCEEFLAIRRQKRDG
jgi:predicted N-formylglutamate amidohydrolase